MTARRKLALTVSCILTGIVGSVLVGYWVYTGSVIMDEADSGAISAGYTTPFQAFALVAGGFLLLCSIALLSVRISKATPRVGTIDGPHE